MFKENGTGLVTDAGTETYKDPRERLKNLEVKKESLEEANKRMKLEKNNLVRCITKAVEDYTKANDISSKIRIFQKLKDDLKDISYGGYRNRIKDCVGITDDDLKQGKFGDNFNENKWLSLKEEKNMDESIGLDRNTFCYYYNTKIAKYILKKSGFPRNDERTQIINKFKTEPDIWKAPIPCHIILKMIRRIADLNMISRIAEKAPNLATTQEPSNNADTGSSNDEVTDENEEKTDEVIITIHKTRDSLDEASKNAASLVPEVLQNFSGNFTKWNTQKYDSKKLKDTSGLGKYQEFIRKSINSSELNQQAAYQQYDDQIKNREFKLVDAMTYATIIGVEIADYGEFKCFIGAVCGEIPNVAKQKPEYLKKYDEYKRAYEAYYQEMIIVEEEIITQIYTESLTARYETATSVAEGRNFYESDFINFTVSNTEQQGQSGLQVASNIDNISEKLNHYKFNTNKSEHEEAALKYTAFDITFKNIFNLTNPIIEKLGAQQVDLRNDLFKYGIYNQDSNTFNQSARDKYVAEKLTPLGFAPEEVKVLLNAIIGLPAEVEKNYEILSGNFNTDQDNFEKIAKIYALGEVIDNIKDLFTNGDILSDNEKLGAAMGFEFDENSADIVGDCLILKGRANGTETKIKYDLRTGKLYMNSFTQIELNPPKITVGNKEPNTEIGDLGNFNDLLEGYQPTSFTQTDKVDYSEPSNNMANGDDAENMNSNDQGNKDSNQKTLEKLMENKLLGKLSEIGNIVKEKAGEQSGENNVIDEFLRTFNILPNNSNQNTSGTIEFTGGFNSNLFILLNSIKDTDKQDELTRFSNAMKELMSYCGLFWGNNNLESKGNEFSSFTIFDIDEKNATQDIISLQKANQSFFSDTGGEKDRIKGCESHFDASVKLSFANIIVQKCCRRSGGSWKVSADLAEEFVNSIKKGIEDIKHDESDVVAMENMIEDESMWA